MRDGACGMATGLIYTPGSFSKTDELIAIAKIVGNMAVSTPRTFATKASQLCGIARRDSQDWQTSQSAGACVAHQSQAARSNWGLAPDAISKLRSARDGRPRVTADQYPYTASSTSLSATLIPDEYRSWEKLKAVLDDPEKGPKLKSRIENALKEREGGETVMIASFSPERTWQGKKPGRNRQANEPNAVRCDARRDPPRRGTNRGLGMNEDEVRLFMREPWSPRQRRQHAAARFSLSAAPTGVLVRFRANWALRD